MKLMLLCIIVMYKCNKLSSELINDDEDSGNELSEKSSQISNNNSNKLATTSDHVYRHPSKIISYVGGTGGGPDFEEDEQDEDADGLVFNFRRSIKSDNTEIEARRRSVLDKNFMRFGRSDKNFMRFGRPDEVYDEDIEKRNDRNRLRFGKKDDRNVLRFGKRRNENMLRFGRSRTDNDRNKVRFGRSDKNFMRFGRDPDNVKRLINQDKNLIRFGRSDPSLINDYNDITDEDDFVDLPELRQPSPERYDELGSKIIRFGKRKSQNLMRFGRANGNLLRFGRANGNLLRFGRANQNLLRFGRAPVTTNVLCIDEKCLLEEKENQIHQILQDRKIADLPNGNNEEIFKYQKISSSRNDEKTSSDLADLFGTSLDDPILRPDTDDFSLKSN